MTSSKLLTTNHSRRPNFMGVGIPTFQASEQSPITIVIPTLNNTVGLNYLLNFFSKLDYPVIVVDNHPTDDKMKSFTKQPSNQSLIYLPQSKNIGFSASINKGAEKVKTDWMLILNDDIEFPQPNNQTTKQLLDYATDNHLVAVSPVLKNEKGEVENYGYKVLPFGRIELITKQPGNQTTNDYLDGLTAACLLIQTDVFNKLSGFDESFFAYLEDVDFFLRLKEHFNQQPNNQATKQPFNICPEVSVFHRHLTTSKTMSNFKQKQDFINWIRLIIKHPRVFRLYKLYELSNFKNFMNLIVERLRNLSGLIKSYIH